MHPLPSCLQSVIDQPVQAILAIDTDYEFYQTFQTAADPRAAAASYIGLIIGCEWGPWASGQRGLLSVSSTSAVIASRPWRVDTYRPTHCIHATGALLLCLLPAVTGSPTKLPHLCSDGDLVYSREANMDLAIGEGLAVDEAQPLSAQVAIAAGSLPGSSCRVLMKTASLKTRINPTGYLRLWDAPDDPWTGTTSRLSLLGQLSNHWNSNMRSQRRTAVHMVRWGRSSLCNMQLAVTRASSAVQNAVLFIRALHDWSSSVPCISVIHPCLASLVFIRALRHGSSSCASRFSCACQPQRQTAGRRHCLDV